MNKRKALLAFKLIILFIMTGSAGLCQTKDAGMWFTLNVQKKFTQALSVNFTQEVRMLENISEASTVFSDLGFEYKLNKHFKLSGNYRRVYDRRIDDNYQSRNRFYFDVSCRKKLKPFFLIVRERAQAEFTGRNTGKKIDPENYSRTKVTLKLDLNKKYTPYIYSEVFNPLNNPTASFIDKTRHCAGIEYQLNARNIIDLNYMVENKFKKERETAFVIGVGYSFVF